MLTIAMRWTDRLLGIVSTLILARLLVPADFGIIAMASLVVIFIDTLLDLGVNAALVQNRTADRDHYDTAWTLRLIQSLFTAALIALLSAPLAADYFNDPRIESVLWIMALSVMVGGLENIGIVALQKNMEFGREFKFFFYRRLAGFLVTLALALWLRSYWAMVFGTLIGRLVGVVLSYTMHEFRPRLSFRKLGEIWGFSQWMLLRNLGIYGAQQIDKILVGRRAGAESLGAYQLADDIAAMPVTELLAPIGRVLLPAFVKLANQPQELRTTFLLALGSQTLIALPAGVGLAAVADLSVPLLLGPQWLPAIPLLQILALISIVTALTHSSGYLLLALGKVRLQAVAFWVQFLLLGATLIFALPNAGAETIAHTRLLVAALAMLAFLWLTLRTLPQLHLRDIVASTWRPVLATAAMAGLLLAWATDPTQPLVWQLLAKVGAGWTAYAAAIWLLWRLAGTPDGPERYLLDKLRPTLASKIDIATAPTVDALPPSAQRMLELHGTTHLETLPWWFAHLQRNVFPNDDVRYLHAHRDGACLAVLPLRIDRSRPVHRIEALTNFYTSLYAPPLRPDAATDDLAALLQHALRQQPPLHELRLAPLDSDSALYRQLPTALRKIGWVPFRYYCFGNWTLAVVSDWPTYLQDRPGEVKNTLKRMGKKFATASGTLHIIQGGDELEAAITVFVDIYNASWKVPEPYPDFMPGLIRHLAAIGALRLGIARLAGRPIATQLWAVQNGRASIIKLAHRKDSSDYSVGTLLTARLMEHVISIDRVGEVDYLIGDDPYKQNWMNQRRERWGIVAYNPKSPMGMLLLLRETLARMIKPRK